MSGPQRAPDQTAISVSIGKELLKEIDARAKSLGLTRSHYLAQLARRDVISGGDIVLKETPLNSTLIQAEVAAIAVARQEAASYKRKKPSK